MPIAPLLGVGISNSVTSPFIVIRPILFALHWVNQRAPSGPTQMHRGPPGPTSPCLGVGNSVISPLRSSLRNSVGNSEPGNSGTRCRGGVRRLVGLRQVLSEVIPDVVAHAERDVLTLPGDDEAKQLRLPLVQVDRRAVLTL